MFALIMERGYYFIDTLEGDVILYPLFPDSVGKNMLDLQDDNGEYVLREEIRIVKEQGEGYIEGYWERPGEDTDTKYRKITFVKAFEPYDWYLGCGEYVVDMVEQQQQELIDYVNSLNYGIDNEQYLFIHDYDGVEIANGMFPDLIGTNNIDLQDEHGTYVLKEQIVIADQAGTGFLTHSWFDTDSSSQIEKLTYVGGIPEWRWVIGTSNSIEKHQFNNFKDA